MTTIFNLPGKENNKWKIKNCFAKEKKGGRAREFFARNFFFMKNSRNKERHCVSTI